MHMSMSACVCGQCERVFCNFCSSSPKHVRAIRCALDVPTPTESAAQNSDLLDKLADIFSTSSASVLQGKSDMRSPKRPKFEAVQESMSLEQCAAFAALQNGPGEAKEAKVAQSSADSMRQFEAKAPPKATSIPMCARLGPDADPALLPVAVSEANTSSRSTSTIALSTAEVDPSMSALSSPTEHVPIPSLRIKSEAQSSSSMALTSIPSVAMAERCDAMAPEAVDATSDRAILDMPVRQMMSYALERRWITCSMFAREIAGILTKKCQQARKGANAKEHIITTAAVHKARQRA
jgi:hypothetical protein